LITAGPTFRYFQDVVMIDLLPDFVGYWLIALGANRLIGALPAARGVRNLALVLAFLSVPEWGRVVVAPERLYEFGDWLGLFLVLSILTTVLDVALIWALCGAIAEWAGAAGDGATAGAARGRRFLYALVQVGGIALAVFSMRDPRAVPVEAGYVVIGAGVLVVLLMMGLMSRARNLCYLAGTSGASEPSGPRPVFRLLMLLAVLTPLAAAAGVWGYYERWKANRANLSEEGLAGLPGRFIAEVRAGRIDAAYALTAPSFRGRMSRDGLAELVRNHPALTDVKATDVGSGVGASSGWGGRDTAYPWTEALTASRRESLSLRPAGGEMVTHIEVHAGHDPDSFLYLHPPPAGVTDVQVLAVPEAPPGLRLP
ncbi:MAG TPA: hypothetical protein VIL46_05560, partial [Gemmataceae bacterium]